MARYYCTCKKGERLPHDYQHTKYHETEVDKEGICVYCGYYAFTRASIQHELFPRHGKKVTALEVYKHVANWEDNELYYQYYHGCSPLNQGLARETLLKDQERIKNGKQKTTERKAIAPTNFNRYKRTSGNGSRPSNRD
jgi:hypothetical protein